MSFENTALFRRDGARDSRRAERVVLSRRRANEVRAQRLKEDLLDDREAVKAQMSRYLREELQRLQKSRRARRELMHGIRDSVNDGNKYYVVRSDYMLGPIVSAHAELDYPEAGFPEGSEFSVNGSGVSVSISPLSADDFNALYELQKFDSYIDQAMAHNYKTEIRLREATDNEQRHVLSRGRAAEGRSIIAFDLITSCAHCSGGVGSKALV
jgi:hypothetical protein